MAECLQARRPALYRAGRALEWIAIRAVTAFIIGMFVTAGMALAG